MKFPIIIDVHRVIIDSYDEKNKPREIWGSRKFYQTPPVFGAIKALIELYNWGLGEQLFFFITGLKNTNTVKKVVRWFDKKHIFEDLHISSNQILFANSRRKKILYLRQIRPFAIIHKSPCVLKAIAGCRKYLFNPTESGLRYYLESVSDSGELMETWRNIVDDILLNIS